MISLDELRLVDRVRKVTTSCKLRKIQFEQSIGWQADCLCGFTSGGKSSFSAAMEEIEKHWNAFKEAA